MNDKDVQRLIALVDNTHEYACSNYDEDCNLCPFGRKLDLCDDECECTASDFIERVKTMIELDEWDCEEGWSE